MKDALDIYSLSTSAEETEQNNNNKLRQIFSEHEPIIIKENKLIDISPENYFPGGKYLSLGHIENINQEEVNVMIIEDDKILRNLLLQSLKFNFGTFQEEAFFREELKKFKFNLYFFSGISEGEFTNVFNGNRLHFLISDQDLGMGSYSGPEIAKFVQEKYNPYIIAMSGRHVEDFSPADKRLSKPFRSHELPSIIFNPEFIKNNISLSDNQLLS
jgi:hypothetical protein